MFLFLFKFVWNSGKRKASNLCEYESIRFPRLQTCLFNICNIMYITMPLLKIFIIVLNKKDFFYLIFYTQNNFYKNNYNKREQQIFTNCRRQCTIFVCFLTFSTKGTLICYIISPLVGELVNLAWKKKRKRKCFENAKYFELVELFWHTFFSENIGKNQSERVLPFNMWVNLPLSTSPYYEIIFTIQVYTRSFLINNPLERSKNGYIK